MRFNEDGELFVHVRQQYSDLLLGTLCFKVIPDTKTYVVGWSTVSIKDITKAFKKRGREIARNRAVHYAEKGQDRSSFFNMAKYSYEPMYKVMQRMAVKLDEDGFSPLDKNLFPLLYFTPFTPKDMMVLFEEPLEGPDGLKWHITGYNKYSHYLVEDMKTKEEYFKSPEEMVTQFRYQGGVLGTKIKA